MTRSARARFYPRFTDNGNLVFSWIAPVNVRFKQFIFKMDAAPNINDIITTTRRTAVDPAIYSAAIRTFPVGQDGQSELTITDEFDMARGDEYEFAFNNLGSATVGVEMVFTEAG